MSRIPRPLLFALLLGVVFSLAGTQVAALTPVAVPVPLRPLCNVTVIGAGPTVPAAIAEAVDYLKTNYLLLSYTVIDSGCSPAEDLDIPGPIDLPVICWAEVRACTIRKVVPLS